MTFVMFPLFIVWKAVDYLIIRGVGALPALLLFGYRPIWQLRWRVRRDSYGSSVSPFVPLSRWPHTTNGHFFPIKWLTITFMLSAGIYFVGYVLVYKWIIVGFFMGIVFTSVIGIAIMGVLAAGIVGLLLFAVTAQSELAQVIVGYISSKKQRLCFLIEFV